jgi:hypothetical protein
MRRAARVDANQSTIVEALRRAGASVQPLHIIGKGCPDLLIGFRGRNLLAEVKDGEKPPSARVLTIDEMEWHARWRGEVYVVESVADAMRLLRDGKP